MTIKLNGEQKSAIAVAIAIFCFVYFGFDIVAQEQKNLEKSRLLSAETTSIQNLIQEAKEKLANRYSVVEALTFEVNEAPSDSIKAEKLKVLSSTFYDLGFPAISAYYAEEVAAIINSPESWSIAGTSYLLGVKNATQEKTRQWSFDRAVKAFETAISLDPGDLDNRINLALGYIELPPADNPMKGILMLRALDNQFPDNPKVITQLGKLSLETNQVDNAIKRLKRAEELDPENKKIICLLAQAYGKAGNSIEADNYNRKCIDN